MQSTENQIVIASAGSRKTTYLVEEAIKRSEEKILVLTYTNENLNQIRTYFREKYGAIPPNVTIQSWFSFLLSHGVRPYQNHLYDGPRVETIYYPERPQDFRKDRRYIKKENITRYYFVNRNLIIADLMSDFVVSCNSKSNGLVVERLEKIYNAVFIDEIQDLAGWDLEIIKLLLGSKISLLLVGDNRQAVYTTNDSNKNQSYKRTDIIDFFKTLEASDLCKLIYKNECYRCNQMICDYADNLYPEMATKTVSKNDVVTGHDGLFLVKKKDVREYFETYNPQVLRYNKKSNTEGLSALNFGLCKGQNYDRVLIFPTDPMKKYLKNGRLEDVGDKSKFYVAVTRARYSVAIVYDGNTCFTEFNYFKS